MVSNFIIVQKEAQQSPTAPDANKLPFQTEDEKANVMIEQDGSYILIPASHLIDALQLIATVDIKISPETKTVFMAGSFATGALILFNYGRALTPAGAFVIALGIGPASAADLCSLYENEEGLKYFFNLSIQKQISEASYCPSLAGNIIFAAEKIDTN
jgi:hypothetical protein